MVMKRSKFSAVTVLLFTFVLITVDCVPVPQEFPTCDRKLDNFKLCLSKAMEVSVRNLRNGIPALKMNPLDPASIPAANIGKGTGPVDVAQNYTDVKVTGISDVGSFNILDIDLEKFKLNFETFSPLLSWQGQYKASGRILLLPIYGDGPANITLVKTKSVHEITGEFYKKKDTTYMKCTTYKLKLIPEKVYYQFNNLFNGNKALGDNMNQVMNDNWKELFEDVGSGYEEVLSLLFQSYCNNVFNKVPFDQIFL